MPDSKIYWLLLIIPLNIAAYIYVSNVKHERIFYRTTFLKSHYKWHEFFMVLYLAVIHVLSTIVYFVYFVLFIGSTFLFAGAAVGDIPQLFANAAYQPSFAIASLMLLFMIAFVVATVYSAIVSWRFTHHLKSDKKYDPQYWKFVKINLWLFAVYVLLAFGAIYKEKPKYILIWDAMEDLIIYLQEE